MQLHLLAPDPTPATLTRDDRYTPAWLVAAARQALGQIALDPASSHLAQTVVQAERFYTPAEDGLAAPWAGTVFLNPPYSNPLPWVARLLWHYDQGAVPAAVVLTGCAASPRWAQLLAGRAAAICYPARRVNFWPRRPSDNGNAGDNLVWYLGPDRDRFAAAFAAYGVVH